MRLKYLYIFPHPDDESFGPALVIARQRRQGHEVHLVTLTKGGATKQRHRLGLTLDQMGDVREQELRAAGRVLDLSGQEVLDMPDGELAELDPRQIEQVVTEHVLRVRPDVLVTYSVNGISGFRDHLVMHAVAKRVYCELRDRADLPLRRLALYTLASSPKPDGIFHLATTPDARISAAVGAAAVDVDRAREALACYHTYAEVIAAANPLERIGETVYFELFGEVHQPPLGDLHLNL